MRTKPGRFVVLSLLSISCGGVVADPAPEETPLTPRPVPDVVGTAPPRNDPENVAKDVGAPSALVLDGDRIVFTTHATILSGRSVEAGALFVADKKVGSALMIAIDRRGQTYGALATDGTRAYVAASDGRIVTTALLGGEEKLVTTLGERATMLAASGNYVYYAHESGAIGRVAKAGGDAQALATIDADVRGIVADATAVYVATAPKAGTDASNAIVRIDLATLESRSIASPHGEPCAMTRDKEKLFWTTAKGAEGTVERVSLDGQGLATIASGTFAACAIAADADNLYFATTSPSSMPVRAASGAVGLGLMRAPIAGGTPTPIEGASQALPQPGAVAVDDKHVYWLTRDAVMRLAKR